MEKPARHDDALVPSPLELRLTPGCFDFINPRKAGQGSIISTAGSGSNPQVQVTVLSSSSINNKQKQTYRYYLRTFAKQSTIISQLLPDNRSYTRLAGISKETSISVNAHFDSSNQIFNRTRYQTSNHDENNRQRKQ